MWTMAARPKYGVAIYGNVSLERLYCRGCRTTSLIVDGRFACCGSPRQSDILLEDFYVECAPLQQRKGPPVDVRRQILERQGGKCLYCEQALGSWRRRNGAPVQLKTHWDHRVPHSFRADRRPGNWAASCHVCNFAKSNKHFGTLEETIEYLAEARKRKGYDF
jgi:hypothetical protein